MTFAPEHADGDTSDHDSPKHIDEDIKTDDSPKPSVDCPSAQFSLVTAAAPLEAIEKAAPAPCGSDPNAFPDGGREAWLVVAGGFCAVFASFGWTNCVGVFQNYYQSDLLSGYSSGDVAWIQSTDIFMMFFCGPVVGKVTDQFGPRVPIMIGSFLHIFGLMMTSLSREYYQIFLSQSVVSAMGCSFLFYPSTAACASWFYRHRALALGIVISGSSIGGVIFPIMVDRLIDEIGFPWTIRAAAFLLLGLVIFSIFTVRSRIPPLKQPFVLADFITPFKEAPFLLLTISIWFLYVGGFIPFTFIVVQARAQGMPNRLAGYLVSILNGASTFGRILPAHLGDRLGVFNVMSLLTALGSIACIALWLPSNIVSVDTDALIIVFTALYGFASGCFYSIIVALIARITPDVRKIGVRTGSLYAVASTGVLIGSPIAGVISSAKGNGFLGLTLFSGLLLLVGTVFVVLARLKLTGLKLMVKA